MASSEPSPRTSHDRESPHMVPASGEFAGALLWLSESSPHRSSDITMRSALKGGALHCDITYFESKASMHTWDISAGGPPMRPVTFWRMRLWGAPFGARQR